MVNNVKVIKYRVYDFISKTFSAELDSHIEAFRLAVNKINYHLKEIKCDKLYIQNYKLIAGSLKPNEVTNRVWDLGTLAYKEYKIKQMVVIMDSYDRIIPVCKLNCLILNPATMIYEINPKYLKAKDYKRCYSMDWNIKRYKANYLGFRQGPMPGVHRYTFGGYLRPIKYKNTLISVDLGFEDKQDIVEYNIKIRKSKAVDKWDIEPTPIREKNWKSQRKARKQWQRNKNFLNGERTYKLGKLLSDKEYIDTDEYAA